MIETIAGIWIFLFTLWLMGLLICIHPDADEFGIDPEYKPIIRITFTVILFIIGLIASVGVIFRISLCYC